MKEFDEIFSQEPRFSEKIISPQTIVTNEDEEIMIVTIGDRYEMRTPTSIGTVLIVILLIIITIKLLSL